MNVLKNKYISYINILNIKCIRIGLIYIINVNIKHLFFFRTIPCIYYCIFAA